MIGCKDSNVYIMKLNAYSLCQRIVKQLIFILYNNFNFTINYNLIIFLQMSILFSLREFQCFCH